MIINPEKAKGGATAPTCPPADALAATQVI